MLVINVLLFIAAVNTFETGKCKTPNGESADCISIYKCPILLDAIKTEDKTVLEFAKDSQCGFDQTPLVCCGNKSTYAIDLLPKQTYCGYQHSDDYISQTHDQLGRTTIDEFPWIAALYYKEIDSKEDNRCVGTLINDRYVLTAAHCLRAPITAVISKVRLGEFNIEQKDDCVSDGGFDVCSDPTADFGIESYIIHEEYNLKLRINDIALIRLNRTVDYSDYIRPICLPLSGTPRAKIGDILFQSGWGLSSFAGERSKVKKKILASLISNEECGKSYKKVKIVDSHLCTKYAPNERVHSCQGDSGGPVMLLNRHQWFQEGIASFSQACGIGPDVNVKVRDYIPWILKNIRL